MKCISCGGERSFEFVHEYDKPDQYEILAGITDVRRGWIRCKCGHYQHWQNYNPDKLEKAYINYRQEDFRGETVRESFDRIRKIKNNENTTRVNWVTTHLPIQKYSWLDVGSGLGVFPYALKKLGHDVYFNELNPDSIKFCKEIGLKQEEERLYDVISMVHVLEHIKDPEMFLKYYKEKLKQYLFIEVPDCIEFTRLPKNHDEFNSCHLHFFSPRSLMSVLERAGFTVTNLKTIHYDERNLDRIMVTAK